jgi:hypothetical protein
MKGEEEQRSARERLNEAREQRRKAKQGNGQTAPPSKSLDMSS